MFLFLFQNEDSLESRRCIWSFYIRFHLKLEIGHL